MRKIVIFCLLFFFAFLFPKNAFAQSDWQIDNFESKIAIEKTGEVSIGETISVDFGSLEKHGIFRDIPVVYTSENGKHYTSIQIQSVLQDNQPAKYTVSTDEYALRIKIGDPNTTISGSHVYIISYVAKGILKSFENYDELYWNVTGNYWDIPIKSAQAVVTVPQDGILKTACFEGPVGSTNTCKNVVDAAHTRADFHSSGLLGPKEGFTIVVGYKKGIVPILIIEKPQSILEQLFSLPSLLFIGFLVLLGIISIFYLWHTKGKDVFFPPTVVVEYEPPGKLRPAELGILMDERADTLDVVATVIDLAARGYLSITEKEKKWIFGTTDYILTKHEKNIDTLLEYEKGLLNDLFEESNTVTISSLKTTFYEELNRVKKEMYENIMAKKLFSQNPESVRGKYIGIGIVLVCIGGAVIYSLWSLRNVYVVDVGIGTVMNGILMAVFSFTMPRRSVDGRQLYQRGKGYKLFIQTAEKHRQRFFEKENMFNQVLPYAIVFGVTDKFMQAMKDIGALQKSPNWYHTTGSFNTHMFGSHISAFSSSFSSTISHSPSRSGFSSGGGSSGGGFGGGGGGSW